MAEILKRTEELKVYSEEEAEALIEKIKEDGNVEGYEIKSYSLTKKQKKEKGEVVDEWLVLRVCKVW